MAKYSIKDLEKISGIKAHTIRIWEKRYQLICPERTCTNIRLYSDDDLKRILNISILNRHGIKISKIAKLNAEEIKEKIIYLTQNNYVYEDQIENMILAMIEFDEFRFEKLLSTSIIKVGFEDTFIKLIYPFFEKVGVLWQTGTINPAQEHFVSNLIRLKLMVSIDSVMPIQNERSNNYLLFLPEGEFHELGLLYYYYLIKKRGHNVLYLGSSVPLTDIPLAVNAFKPDFLVTFFVTPMKKQLFDEYIHTLSTKFPDLTIYLSGLQISNLHSNLPENIIKVMSPVEFNEAALQYA